jgi:hypothetical protein
MDGASERSDKEKKMARKESSGLGKRDNRSLKKHYTNAEKGHTFTIREI